MLCRMCFLDSSDALSIFEGDSAQFEIAQVIARHFWFEPTKNDNISNMICRSCWNEIKNFHIYFLSVEEAQNNQAEILAIKQESAAQHVVVLKVETEFSDIELVDKNVPKKSPQEVEKVDLFDGSLDENSQIFEDGAASNNEDDDDDDDDSSSDYEPLSKKIENIRNAKQVVQSLPELNNFIKSETEENHEKSNTSIETIEEPKPKKKRGRKRKSEKVEKVVNPENTEYRKKSKEYDDEIAQFMKLKCDMCLFDFRTFAEIKRHYRSVHNRKGYVICCTTRKFYKRVFLYEHIQKHKNPDHFKCNFCEKVYCSASVLKSHLMTHDASFEKLFQCDKCPRRFAKLSILNHHKIIHIPKDQHTFRCDVCGKSFPTKNTMQTHRKSVHEKAYAKMCHICAKVICGKTLFAKHQLEHIGITDPRVKCEKCGTWLKNEFRLKIHTKKHHTDEAPGEHICNICGKVSPSSVGLKSHIRYVHSALRKYQCSVCEKGFKTALNLKEHMTTHTGDVLYTCPHCPKTFNSSANMHSHRKKMHREEWEESRRSRGLPVETHCSTAEKERTLVIEAPVENITSENFDYVSRTIECRLDLL